MSFIDQLKFREDGLIPVILQDWKTGEVLTLAYMNRDAVLKTVETGHTWFWRRSKQKLMMKGEQSGNVQRVKEIWTDCDQDALVIKIEQVGDAACHTGHRSCFYMRRTDDDDLEVVGEPLFDPDEVYGKQG